MKLKTYLFRSCVLAASLAGFNAAHAYTYDSAVHSYVRASALWIVPDGNLFDNGAGALVAIGTQFGDIGETWQHQFEFEAGWGKMDFKKGLPVTGDLQTVPLLLTYRAVWSPVDSLKIGFGPSIGFTRFDVKVNGLGSDDDWVFSYGLGVLASWDVSERVSLDFGYRYLWNEDPELGGGKLPDSDMHVLQVGLRFAWPQ